MPTSFKVSGEWETVSAIWYKDNGEWKPVQRAYIKVAGVWVETFAAAVIANVTETTTALNLSSLFSAEDWASSYKKKVVNIAAGVIVGSTNAAVAALITGTDMGGWLEVNISGEVQGAGGAINSGDGGAAINNQLAADQLTITVLPGGAIRGGGGGGGKGGTGGGGQYSTGVREPSSGEYYDSSHRWEISGSGTSSVRWAGSVVASAFVATSVTVGGVTYYRGSIQTSDRYAVYRTYTTTTNTNGGAGGNGGRGRGYDGALAAGAAGANGGTNAGKGGTGGTGGSWGAAGAKGATGANGNRTNGVAGVAGGDPGAAITGAARIVVNNGTINGAY